MTSEKNVIGWYGNMEDANAIDIAEFAIEMARQQAHLTLVSLADGDVLVATRNPTPEDKLRAYLEEHGEG